MAGNTPTNGEVASAFELLGDLLELEGAVRHRVLAYRRGAGRVRAATESVAAMALAGRATELPDIGPTLQAKIVELTRTGAIAALEAARARTPEGLVAVARLEGIGPKRAAALHRDIGVASLDDLRAALAAGRLRDVAGFGPRTEAALREQLDRAPEDPGDRRVPMAVARPVAEALADQLRAAPGVHRVEIAGSLRRGRETVHDIDLVVAADDPAPVFAALAGSGLVQEVLSGGDLRRAVMTQPGVRAEVAVAPPGRFGNLLQHATGSARHNVRLRELAVRRGLSVSEHGIAAADGAVALHPDESGVYAALGLDWIPPELREDRGELDLAATGGLPRLVEAADLRGDLHVHSDWSDGHATIEAMARAARDRGYRYLGIADHSVSLAMAGGLSPDRVRAQWEAIAEIDARLEGITVLRCTEVDILADGRLDFDDALLAGFDFVTASLHGGLRRPRAEVTARVLAAVEHPHVDAIGHPTARMFGRRDGVDLDLERVVERAAATGTLLEVNGQPRRLDLETDHARLALAAGVRLLLSSDAHYPRDLAMVENAVTVARRAGAGPGDVANTRPVGRWRE
jgi:DNA polymerase (family 10)